MPCHFPPLEGAAERMCTKAKRLHQPPLASPLSITPPPPFVSYVQQQTLTGHARQTSTDIVSMWQACECRVNKADKVLPLARIMLDITCSRVACKENLACCFLRRRLPVTDMHLMHILAMIHFFFVSFFVVFLSKVGMKQTEPLSYFHRVLCLMQVRH